MAPQPITAPGVTKPIPIAPRLPGDNTQPVIMTFVSDGAALTYSVEGTVDKADANGAYPDPGRWLPLTFLIGLSAGQDATIIGKLSAVRVRYLQGTGSVTIDVGQ